MRHLTEVVWLEDPEAPVEVRLLSEDGTDVTAVSLAPALVASALQQDDGALGNVGQTLQSLADFLPVLSKQLNRNLESVQSHGEISIAWISLGHYFQDSSSQAV